MTIGLYPFATKEGRDIRADILEPKAFLESVTTTGWTGGVDCSDNELLVIDVENTAGIAFTVDGITPPPIVPAGEFSSYPAFIVEPPKSSVLIKVPDAFPFIWWTAEGNNTTGYIYLISVQEWNTLTTQAGLDRY